MNSILLNNHPLQLFFLATIGGIIGILLAINFYYSGILLLMLVFVIFVRNPELPLAIQFNGTLFYLYAVYKLGFETSTLLTGGWFGFLICAYILGGLLLISKKKPKVKLIDILFICFYSWAYLTYFLFYTGGAWADTKATFAPVFVIAPYLGARFLISEESINKFYKYCAILPAILIIPSFYELIFNPIHAESARFSLYFFDRPGQGANPILFGATFAIFLLILIVRLQEKRFRLVYIVLMFPSLFLLLRAGTRGVVVAFLASLLSYLLLVTDVGLRKKVFTIIVLVLLALGAYWFIPEATIEFHRYALTQDARSETTSSVYTRILYWQEALRNFGKNPILGVGMGNSLSTGFPHNIFFETAAEFGILGLLMLTAMFVLTIKKALAFLKRKGKLHSPMAISLLLFVFSLVEAMFSGHIANQTMLFMSMGVIVSFENVRKKPLEKP